MNGKLGQTLSTLGLSALLLAACDPAADDPARKGSGGDTTIVVQEQSGGACGFLKNFPLRLEALASNARTVMSSNDSCVLPLVDSVITGVRENRDPLYLTVLDSLCSYSDGEVGDAMSMAASGMLLDSIPTYTDHLYRNGPGSCLAQHVIWGLQLEYMSGEGADPKPAALEEARRDLEKRALRSVGENDVAKRKFITALLDNTFASGE